jgi:hypothetical protein
MSAPEFRTQDQFRKAQNIIVKFKEGWKMKVATKATKIKMVLSRGLATQHPVKLVGILALGAMLIASTAVQFAPGAGEESVNNSAVEKPEAILKSADLGGVDSEYRFMDLEDEPLSVEFLRTYVYPEEAAQVKAPTKSVDSEYRFMDLEDEPLSVEFLRTYVYPEERPSRSEASSSHKQGIERLEGEMSILLDEARQDPSTDPLELDRDLRNLDYRIGMLRLAAMEQQ